MSDDAAYFNHKKLIGMQNEFFCWKVALGMPHTLAFLTSRSELSSKPNNMNEEHIDKKALKLINKKVIKERIEEINHDIQMSIAKELPNIIKQMLSMSYGEEPSKKIKNTSESGNQSITDHYEMLNSATKLTELYCKLTNSGNDPKLAKFEIKDSSQHTSQGTQTSITIKYEFPEQD